VISKKRVKPIICYRDQKPYHMTQGGKKREESDEDYSKGSRGETKKKSIEGISTCPMTAKEKPKKRIKKHPPCWYGIQ